MVLARVTFAGQVAFPMNISRPILLSFLLGLVAACGGVQAASIELNVRGEVVARVLTEPTTIIAKEIPHTFISGISKKFISANDPIFKGAGAPSFADLSVVIIRHGGVFRASDGVYYGLSDPDTIVGIQISRDSYQLGWRFEIVSGGDLYHMRFVDAMLDAPPKVIETGPTLADVPSSYEIGKLTRTHAEDDLKADGSAHVLLDGVTVRILQ